MADALYPILRFGVAVPPPRSQDPLPSYAIRSFRGVETPAAAPADRRGFNEEAEWTGRGDASMNAEHDEAGNHDTIKIPRGLLRLIFDVTITDYDWHWDRRSSESRSLQYSAIGTINRTGVGVVEVTLNEALPSSVRLGACAIDEWIDGIGFVRTIRGAITSASKFEVKRFAGATIAALAAADGDMSFTIVSG